MEASRAGTGANIKKRRRTWKKLHWTPKEDELLTELVERYGPGKWSHIAKHIRGRKGMSCRTRWVNHLSPRVLKTPFSDEEHIRLLKLHLEFGNKWSTFVSFFPGRTDNQLKNQYHVLVGSRRRKVSSPSSSSDHRDAAPFLTSVPDHKTSFGSTNIGNVCANLRTSHGDLMIFDAGSAVISKHFPEGLPQSGVSVKNYQFIDFLGVGNSE